MSKARKYSVKLLGKVKLNKETFEFRFSKPKNFKFTPGQYLKMYLEIKTPDLRGSSRYFTISSSSGADYISITTKVIKSSFKKKLSKLRRGGEVSIFAPIGYFDVDIKDRKDKVFLAGGIGITPYHSILWTLAGKRLKFMIFLFVSFSSLEDSIYFDELKAIELKNRNIKVIYTLSKESGVGFEKGRINMELIKKYVPKIKNSQFYIVGSEAVEKSLTKMLIDANIKEENIFSENFPGY